jgi:hypothetical protein
MHLKAARQGNGNRIVPVMFQGFYAIGSKTEHYTATLTEENNHVLTLEFQVPLSHPQDDSISMPYTYGTDMFPFL